MRKRALEGLSVGHMYNILESVIFWEKAAGHGGQGAEHPGMKRGRS